MEQKNLPEQKTKVGEMNITQSATNAHEQQINELKELTSTLMQTVQTIQLQANQKAKFDDTMADLKATARAMIVSPTLAPQYAQPAVDKCSCKDEACGCVSNDCCCFEIVLSKVRAAKPQIEAPDMGDVPLLTNAMEVRIYATNNNIGVLLPGLATTMELRADGAPGGPGPWVVIERVINKVCIKKGTIAEEHVFLQVMEDDGGVERPIAFKDELGEASGSITLDCCMQKIYPPTPIDVSLNHGGEGRGMIQVAFYARRVTC